MMKYSRKSFRENEADRKREAFQVLNASPVFSSPSAIFIHLLSSPVLCHLSTPFASCFTFWLAFSQPISLSRSLKPADNREEAWSQSESRYSRRPTQHGPSYLRLPPAHGCTCYFFRNSHPTLFSVFYTRCQFILSCLWFLQCWEQTLNKWPKDVNIFM